MESLVLIIASILLVLFNLVFRNSDLVIRVLLSISSVSLVASILRYKDKLQLSLILLAVSELFGTAASIIDTNNFYISNELAISFIGIFIGVYLVAIRLGERQEKIDINSILQSELKPVKMHLLFRVMLLTVMITTVFVLTPVYKNTTPEVTLIGVLYMMLPLFIVMLSVITSYDALLLRVGYYFLWLVILQQGVDVGMVSTVAMLEPFVLLVITIYTIYTDIRSDKKL